MPRAAIPDRMSTDEQANRCVPWSRWNGSTGDPEELLIRLALGEIAGDEVRVFTPKGQVIVLPARALLLISPMPQYRGRRAPHRGCEGERSSHSADTRLVG